MAADTATTPWHAAYPAPRNAEPAAVTREEVLALMESTGDAAHRAYVLVDLRRNDHEVMHWLSI